MIKTSHSVSDLNMLAWPEVHALVPLSRATIWSLRRRDLFPQPVQISPGRIAWRENDIRQWLLERAGKTNG